MNVDERIQVLKRRRANIKAACTRCKNYFDTFNVSNQNIIQAKIRLEKLNESWSQYNEVQAELELLVETEIADREFFENSFFVLSSKIKLIINNAEEPARAASSGSSSPTFANNNNIRLSKITLPTFSGNYDDWKLDAVS